MLKAKNWSSHQSYKDRRPPWIRMHKSLLDNYEYQSMNANARALLPMLWLLASEHEDPTSGIICEDSEKIAFRLRLKEVDVSKGIADVVSAGFFEDITIRNESVTKPYVDCTFSVTSETEKRQSREEKRQSILSVFKCWKTTLNHKRSNLDDKRKKQIEKALSLGYSSDELQQAIIGCSKSDFHMGVNDRGQKYDSINLIFRDADQIDKFIMIATNGGAKAGRQSMVGKLSSSAIDGFVDEQSVIEVVAHG